MLNLIDAKLSNKTKHLRNHLFGNPKDKTENFGKCTSKEIKVCVCKKSYRWFYKQITVIFGRLSETFESLEIIKRKNLMNND